MTVAQITKPLERYLAHDDATTRICNVVALVIVANQPFYPLYIWGALGRPDPWVLLTFLSTPSFAAVPMVSRRHARSGRLMLVLTGIANTAIATGIYGPGSGVPLFLLPCLLIAAACFHDEERLLSIGVCVLSLAIYFFLRQWPDLPLCGCSTLETHSLITLHVISVGTLIALIGFLVRPSASPVGPTSGQERQSR